MAVPVVDRERLLRILAYDLEPRVQWAYDLEQEIDILSGGGLTTWGLASTARFTSNGDPNGVVTAFAIGDLCIDNSGTPSWWIANGAGTVWTELGAGGGGGGAPTTADYLVGTAQAGLSAEIVVGATPGGELGNTWASPTVDPTHSGSSHAATQAAAEATAASALSGHVTDATDAHDASAVSFVPAGTIAATNVQAAIEEVAAEAGSGSLDDAVILAPATSARNVIEGTGDITSLTVKATGDEVVASTPVFHVQEEDGNTINGLKVSLDPINGNHQMLFQREDAFVFFQVFAEPGVLNQSAFSLNDDAEFVWTENLLDPSQSEVRLYLRALEGQVTELIQVDGEVDGNYGFGQRVFKVLVTGAVVSNAVDEPADAEIGSGTRASGLTYWLDDTAGAPTIKFKAKDSAGDMFTATIPMTAV